MTTVTQPTQHEVVHGGTRHERPTQPDTADGFGHRLSEIKTT